MHPRMSVPPRRATRAALALALMAASPALALSAGSQVAATAPAPAAPGAGAAASAAAAPAPGADPAVLAKQWAEYQAVKPKSVLELQPYRQESDATLASGAKLRFVSLNPNVDAWFLASVTPKDGGTPAAYHLENPFPARQKVAFSGGDAPALQITAPDGSTTSCTPWAGDPSELSKAQDAGMPFAPICGGRLYLRNRSVGASSTLESVTDFLRHNVWGGDAIVNFVKDNFYQDAFAQTGKVTGDAAAAPDAGPGHAAVETASASAPSIAGRTGLVLTGTSGGRMELGAWYPVTDLPGVFASAMEPALIAPEILHGPGKTNPLDKVEARAIDYFVAFDLAKFNIGYAVGTAHPAVDWSPRPPANMQNADLPGPDGIGNTKPLVRLGMIDPKLAPLAVATFTGGYKREHGAFHRGPLAEVNAGSHYGFIEEGVILSKLQPGLSTIYVLADGTIGMKTWTAADNAMLPKIRYARQNGVPILETDPATGRGVPGQFVTNWAAGNWSGSAEAQLRTLRGGACMKVTPTTRYLVYGYFSTATPSAMARSFEAYGCSYAMQLDMNALEHTYLALYVHHAGEVHIEHLIPGMAAVDKKGKGGVPLPRFIAFPDNRDMFFLTRKTN